MFFESFKMAFSSIWVNKSRSFLTVLGIIIGVSSVILMLALGEGTKKSILEMIEGFGTNSVFVVSGKIEKGRFFNPVSTIGVSTITPKDVETIERETQKVKNVSPMTLIVGTLNYNGKVFPSPMIISTNSFFADAVNLEVEKGKFISDDDLKNKSKVIVIGSALKEELFGDKDPIGEFIKFRNFDFKVIGYFKKPKNSLQFGDASVGNIAVIPRTTGIEITGNEQIFRIAMEAKSSEDVSGAVSEVKSIVLKNHQGTEDFSVLTQEDIVSIASSILDLLSLLVVLIAAVSLVVGGIGIMNMMLVTVTERTKEVGIRKAIGAKNLDILIQFLIEAVVISIIGGFLGIFSAIGISFFIDKFTDLSPVLNLNFIILAFLVSFFVGIIFGLMPAIRASKKDPNRIQLKPYVMNKYY